MKPKPCNKSGIGITLRTALWSWVVTLGTLLIFVVVSLPQQKRTFQQNLESKAHGVAVALRDVAAGEVVNQDYGSVVQHCLEMVNSDPSLDYLVVTKNDGFSLVIEHSGWRNEPKLGAAWVPAAREPHFGIGNVPLFNRRVFHYSQPFDYSGIEWGWIHVGLSLGSYDRTVKAVYFRTIVLAIACVALSMAASGVYARHLVRPILSLRNTVQRVAGGDLEARAEIDRHDELGTLAVSVNAMTEALQRRDAILESVRFAAQQFLTTSDWRGVMRAVLAKIGQAAHASRAYLFEN
ncbi:MAG TPA: HAMP domain-containing protein, partial [Verrucomicrobiae bacterium]|nr:HAMP domain-containing protein [Verrucomicrobiae bacterium]